MVTDISTVLNRKRVIDFAAKRLLPAIYEYAFLAHDGGLMAYGPNMDAIFDRAAGLVDQDPKRRQPRRAAPRTADPLRSRGQPGDREDNNHGGCGRLGLPGNR